MTEGEGPPPAVLLTQPRDGLPAVVEDETALAGAASRLAAGDGPVAVDAERASGYRYGSQAYLVQFRRHRINFRPQPGARLIHEVNGLVRKEPVSDVPVGQGGRGYQGAQGL